MNGNNGIVNIIKQNGCVIESIGTGFLVGPNQLLTCLHVVMDAKDTLSENIRFKFEDSDYVYIAKMYKENINKNIDIALLYTEESFSSYYRLERDWNKGQECYTKGFPQGSTKLSPSKPILEDSIDNGCKFKLNNANDICGGFSGAPLINDNGDVIGVIVSTPESLRTTGNMLNVAHAIPTSLILNKLLFLENMNYERSYKEKRTIVVEYLNKLKEGCEKKLKEIHLGLYPLSGDVYTKVKHRYYGAEDMDLRIDFQKFDEDGEKRDREDDICKCVDEFTKKIVLLGEPGCGKSVSLLKLTIDYAVRAMRDEKEPIPILIPLGSYKDDVEPIEYVKKRIEKDTISIDAIFNSGKCIFIFDALNEVVSTKRELVVSYIKSLEKYIVSCRLLDYKKEFSNQKDIVRIEILELTLPQIYDAVTRNTYGRAKVEFWKALGGSDALLNLWTNLSEIGKEELFWKVPTVINTLELQEIKEKFTSYEYEAWEKMHSLGLMSLCRNPMLLRMLYDLYLKNKTNLPENRGQLFEQFVNTCLDSEMRKMCNKKYITLEQQRKIIENTLEMLTKLSEMIISRKQGTGIKYLDGYKMLKESFTESEIAEMERFAHNANILIANEDEYRFIHQLHQEYFASRFMYSLFKNKGEAGIFFNQQSWWLPEGWEEVAVLLMGILDGKERNKFLIWLSDVQPQLVVRCIEKSGINGFSASTLDASTKETIQKKWLLRINNNIEGIKSRIYIGKTLDIIGDPRIGLGTMMRCSEEIPKIEWISTHNKSLYVSKYPITVKQYTAFVNAEDGYFDESNWDYSIESRAWREKRNTMSKIPKLGNAPMVFVSWYDAVAFCKWLSKKENSTIRLPFEAEWIQLIESFKPQIINISEKDLYNMTDFDKMISVGINSEVDCLDSSISDIGLVWEWCEDLYGRKPPQLGIINSKSLPTCVLKGGSWRCSEEYKTSLYRCRTYADQTSIDIGFRVVKVTR